MIISRKKFNEKIREAIEQAERERWIHEKIDRVERECNERIEGVLRYCAEFEKRLESLSEGKK